MNAIVPLNIAAIRVNNNDSTNVVSGFQGNTATFSNMPWYNGTSNPPTTASLGDMIYTPLGETAGGAPLVSPSNPLGIGVHLHWELPDYFKRGTQPADGSSLEFPPAPNRWLVTRFLSFYNASTQSYGTVTTKSWVVESDFIAATISPDQYGIVRPAISVPLAKPATGTQPPYNSIPAYMQQPFMYMGRVVDYNSWNPATESASNYLPAYLGPDGKPLYLTAIGFVGAYFGSYYPECSSVFGFWDNFADVPFAGYKNMYSAIKANAPMQFRVTYQVSGWVNDASSDPLANIDTLVTDQYNQYLAACQQNQVDPQLNPTDFFQQITAEKMKWTFNLADVGYTLNNNYQIQSLDYPERTLCAGTAQEVVWNMLTNVGTTYFLQSNAAPTGNGSVWNSQVELAVGNSTEEAVSAMLKYDMGQTTDDPNILNNYEYLLDALQLGLLADLEKMPNKLIALEEALHSNGFARLAGGQLWIVTNGENSPDSAPNPDEEVTLPLALAELLYLLNQAQKNYDMGRAALSTMRKQLYMDWSHYLKTYTASNPGAFDPYVSLSSMTSFLYQASGSSFELQAVINEGNKVGILSYVTDEVSGNVIGINPPLAGISTTSLAYQVYQCYQDVLRALAPFTQWHLQCAKAPDFFLPSEPVILMEGEMMEPIARNGEADLTFVRLSQEILSLLNIYYQANLFTVTTAQLGGIPIISTSTPMQADVQAVVGEAFLITPMLASVVAAAVLAKGGSNNPAAVSMTNFVNSLMYIQGGLSPLDTGKTPGAIPAPPSDTVSLFATVGSASYRPAANPQINTITPMTLEVIFSNGTANGWPPNTIGWRTQTALPAFGPSRVDPFLPIFMIWTLRLNPLQWSTTDSNGNPAYSPTNITEFFELDHNAVDYQYLMQGDTAVDFTSPLPVTYGDSSTMSSNSTGALVFQIVTYINNHPGDPENGILQQIADLYGSRNFLSQSINGFNIEQVLASFVAQVPVYDLAKGTRDNVTNAVAAAAISANVGDNWYDFAFNNLLPLSTGPLPQGNFGPLRAGFMEIQQIEIVDAFGQRMDLSTANQQQGGPLEVITSYAMSPQPDDLANQGRIYLAPRVLTPTRLWFQWLSATFDPAVAGITQDFPEMNSHPATSPVCGWVMPNHLDDNLFFYKADGSPIGTFGVEHQGTLPSLVYRTRAGNTNKNPHNLLSLDIGEPGAPTVNPVLANYMWYLDAQTPTDFDHLMKVILDSADFINPSRYAQDPALSVLIGRPLALTRVVVGLETEGNLLPISQADTSASSPFAQDVNNGRYNYQDRMDYSSAQLGTVNFPLRLGDLANLDDGLVGYLIEGSGSNPYTNAIFYAPAARPDMTGAVQEPTATTVQLQLNAAATHLTFLVDPRAGVHATTGILPVNELAIPPDQYSEAMGTLAVNFTTRPMLKMNQGFMVPLPAEAGYSWSWITPGGQSPTPLTANAANETPVYGYTPQTIQEGWLELTPDPGNG